MNKSGARSATSGLIESSQYDIGYKKPPEHSRFKKGQSGNPKGRLASLIKQRNTERLDMSCPKKA